MADTTENTTPMVTFLEFTLPVAQSDLRIEKLKSGKYYEAQKVYTDWLRDLQSLGTVSKKLQQSPAVGEEMAHQLELLEAQNNRANDILTHSDEFAEKKLKLLAICLNMDIEKVKDFYPEDLDVIFDKAVALNNFLENLKKSVAPTMGIGA